jgi:hypothetical protein
MTNREKLAVLYKKYDLTKDQVFKSPQGWTIITRAGIDKIQAQAKITITYKPVDEFTSVVDNIYCIKAIGVMGDSVIETFGESNPKNCRVAYPIAICEKRAMSRVVLKLTGFYELDVHGEDESWEDLSQVRPKNINN